MTPTSGSPISVSHANATVSATSSRLRRSGQLTITSANPKRPLESLKDCSIQPHCQYHEAALWASFKLVARYQGFSGRLRRGSLARLLGILQHKPTLMKQSRRRPWYRAQTWGTKATWVVSASTLRLSVKRHSL